MAVPTFTQMMLEPCLPQCPPSRPRSILYSALPGRTFCSSIRANARLYLSVRTTTSNTLLAKLRGKSSRQVEPPSALATNGTTTSLLSHQWNIMSQRQGSPSLRMAVWASSRETCHLYLEGQWWTHASYPSYCMVQRIGASHRT